MNHISSSLQLNIRQPDDKNEFKLTQIREIYFSLLLAVESIHLHNEIFKKYWKSNIDADDNDKNVKAFKLILTATINTIAW